MKYIIRFLTILFVFYLIKPKEEELNKKLAREIYKDYKKEIYQDIVINGKTITKGFRVCPERYEPLKPLFNKFKRPFSVLDIGASQGYFSFKIASDYPHAVITMIENNYRKSNKRNNNYFTHTAEILLDICERNTEISNVMYLQKTITVEDLQLLAKNEHFDVVICFNVIHHLGSKWKELTDAVFSLGDHILIEIPPSTEKIERHENITDIEKYINDKKGVTLAQTYRHTDKTALANVTYFNNEKKTYLNKQLFKHKNTKDFDYIIKSNFEESRSFEIKSDGIIVRPWRAGISLATFKAFNGVFPDTEVLEKAILNLNKTTYGDLLSSNIILQGKNIATFDNLDNSNPPRCIKEALNFIKLKEYEDIKNEILKKQTCNKRKISKKTKYFVEKDLNICPRRKIENK